MIHRTLYKRDAAFNLRIWYAEIAGSAYRSHAGIQGGAIVTSDWTICEGNQQRPDPVAQAAFEVDAMYRHRLARTYHETPEGADSGAHFFEPMLAQKYADKHFEPGDIIQKKYDGARNVGSSSGVISREGKPFISVPHIAEAVRAFLDYEPDFMGDGELFGYGLPRQKIMSLIRKTKNLTPFDIRQSAEHVRWYLYDLPHLGHLPYIERWKMLNAYTAAYPHLFAGPEFEQTPDARPFIVVPTYVVNTREQFDAFHAKCVGQDGLDGSIYRKRNGLYENKRSWGLLKRKDFLDDEYEVLAIHEGNGNWGGAAKTMTCRALPVTAPGYGPDNPLYHRTFNPTTTGSYAANAQILKDYLETGRMPKVVTVKYVDLSVDGIPQHCNVIDLHWEGRQV